MIRITKFIFMTAVFTAIMNPTFSQETKLKVLQLNIWQEGTMVNGGYTAIVNEIYVLQPDLVTLSEVRNYKDLDFCQKLVQSLLEKGKQYYSFYSNGAGILSAFPISSHGTIFSDKGEICKAITNIKGHEIAVYSAHLDYLNYAVYLPRGYSGTTWKKLDKPVSDIKAILADNLASKRDEAIAAFITESKKDIAMGRLVFLGGDFNEASHLDWVKSTKDSFDHNGLVIPWQNSITLYKNGFKDSFRIKYPDPLKNPGFTFPASNDQVEIKSLAWAPDADERERIDFIYYYPNKHLKLENSSVVGPSASILRNERKEEKDADSFIKPKSIWPTDHKGLLSVFKLN